MGEENLWNLSQPQKLNITVTTWRTSFKNITEMKKDYFKFNFNVQVFFSFNSAPN